MASTTPASPPSPRDGAVLIAALIAHKLLDALRASFALDQHELRIGGSIGISLYPPDGADIGTLLRAADAAMYQAKRRGRDTYRFYTAAPDEPTPTAKRRRRRERAAHESRGARDPYHERASTRPRCAQTARAAHRTGF